MFLPKFSYHKVELLPTDAKLNSLFNLGNKFEKKLNLASRRQILNNRIWCKVEKAELLLFVGYCPQLWKSKMLKEHKIVQCRVQTSEYRCADWFPYK